MARTLNLGIVAHVDAGKTSLTERLLFDAGVIDRIGSVDEGTTQTDAGDLERRRGITIRSAVVSFGIGTGADAVTVNLIDTPGHPDFIAEVERVLGVLDGAVLVLSAVEGVQAQTRVLMRTLRRLRIPTLLFVNKIDRTGADVDRVLDDVARRLTPTAVAMATVRDGEVLPQGPSDAAFTARLAEVLAEHDDALLAAYVDGALPYGRLRRELVAQVARAQVYPVFAGSAITGAGVESLTSGIAQLLPAPEGDPDGPLSGTVFKIERGPAGEKVAYARLFSGTVRVRDRLEPGGKVTALAAVDGGRPVPRPAVTAGQIATLRGLPDIRVGDPIGTPRPGTVARHFAPPTLETVVVPSTPADGGALHAALTLLAEQDPLIDLRRDGREIAVSLYGEVQKEVVQATLAEEFGLDVAFRGSTTICVERVDGVGAAVEVMKVEPNPFLATVGLRVEPGPEGSGTVFRLGVELGSMPYAFFVAVEETVRETLQQGLRGWHVLDCTVTMTHSGYAPRQSHAHATFDKSMSSTARDFRHLTPLVLMNALQQAGTTVHEPVHRFHLEVPADTYGAVLPALSRLRAVPQAPLPHGTDYLLDGLLPAASVHELEQLLPALTRGEGVLESEFDHYEPVTGPVPRRPRTDDDPLHRKDYLLRVERRVRSLP
ncbi:ribosomal protection tetracycline resistance protein [Pseudonocardia hierapolitana]|uniref:Ribosomal protection tetracycline resistance protein n=1 Tax=Pseudonocardia hierapolitana TaxID=1128676 RepID=A0A561T2T7_9PSEU|nr:TetM/TetW/TetO/TetS family tetracycline resistance ribosomal protection protein [Pseudonocardia hierapolitana]TWF81428.1 ribosomal protection tetracycline resistance protein [Pseudonocardia hierapolitana]